MIGGGRTRRARITTIIGVSVAVAALLALGLLPATSSALRLQRQAVRAASGVACDVGDSPTIPGYDPVTREMYVPNFGSGNISVLSGTCKVVGTIPLPSGAEPVQAVFDPADNYMLVTDFALNQIYEISGKKVVFTITNDVIASNFAPFSNPWGIAYAPDVAGLGPGVVVSNHGANDLTLLDLSDFLAPEPPVYVGSEPEGMAYDTSDNLLWVANSGNGTVSVANPVSGFAAFTFSVGDQPQEVTFDLANDYVYVTNTLSDNVTVFNGLLGYERLVGSISGFDLPVGAAGDQSTLQVFVANYGNSKIFVIGGSSGLSIVKREATFSSAGAEGVAYDAANGDVYATGYAENEVYVLT